MLSVYLIDLKNKVGVVDFANAQGLVMFQSPRAQIYVLANH